jgi:hypothetical protein
MGLNRPTTELPEISWITHDYKQRWSVYSHKPQNN